MRSTGQPRSNYQTLTAPSGSLPLEHWISFTSMATVTLLSVIGVMLVGRWVIVPLSILVLLGLLLNLTFYFLERARGPSHINEWLARLGNIALVTAGMYLSGGLASPFLPLYSVYIVTGAVRHGHRGAVRGILLSFASLLVLLALEEPPRWEAGLRLLITTGLLALAGFISGELGQRSIDAVAAAERHAGEMAVLNEIGKAISANMEIAPLLEEIRRQAGRLMDVSHFYIVLVDESGEHFTSPLLYRAGHREQHSPENLEADLAAHVIRTGKPLLLRNARDHPQAATPGTVCYRCRSWVGAPLTGRGRVLGAIAALSYARSDAFSQADADVLQAIASQAAVALENARLYQELQERTARLHAAYEALSAQAQQRVEFVRTISHDLRAPLTFIKGYAMLMSQGELGEVNERQREALETIISKSDMLAQMAEDMVLAEQRRLDATTMMPLSLSTMAHEAVRGAQAMTDDQRLVFRVEAPADIPLVLANPLRMERVFDNLLSNAVKYSPDGGTITVRVRQAGDYVQVTVADEGIGIPPDEVEHIFERFYRGNGRAAQVADGFGLGLSIVKEIVEEHGGQIWVDSEVGVGSAFHFTVPLPPQRPARPPGRPRPPAPPAESAPPPPAENAVPDSSS